MKYLDEFRDAALARQLASRITQLCPPEGATLMEVCGTHTVAVFRYGIRGVLPPGLRLLSGPGCPVCVTPNAYIDAAVAYSRRDGTIVATFGDMLYVPGSSSSLQKERSCGRDIRIVYSSLDSVVLAERYPEKTVIFLGVGFETTAPTVAAAILAASERGLGNYLVLSGHKLIPPAMRALVSAGEVFVGGFLCPGHVSVVIGVRPYEFLAAEYGIPCVITGFEPIDILQGIGMLAEMIRADRAGVEIEYQRAVKPEGNPQALEVMYRVFEPADSEWRGLGFIPDSGLLIRQEFQCYDAMATMPVEPEETVTPSGCRCGDVLKGVISPLECALFGCACTPEVPQGPCMVSSEGTCAAYYSYAPGE